jgi:hypothetical protein
VRERSYHGIRSPCRLTGYRPILLYCPALPRAYAHKIANYDDELASPEVRVVPYSEVLLGERLEPSEQKTSIRFEVHCSNLCAEGLNWTASANHIADCFAAASAASFEEYAAPERYVTGVQVPRSSGSRLNSSNPKLPSGREKKSTHRSCSKFSRLAKTSQDLSIRRDIA